MTDEEETWGIIQQQDANLSTMPPSSLTRSARDGFPLTQARPFRICFLVSLGGRARAPHNLCRHASQQRARILEASNRLTIPEVTEQDFRGLISEASLTNRDNFRMMHRTDHSRFRKAHDFVPDFSKAECRTHIRDFAKELIRIQKR